MANPRTEKRFSNCVIWLKPGYLAEHLSMHNYFTIMTGQLFGTSSPKKISQDSYLNNHEDFFYLVSVFVLYPVMTANILRYT
jgi:hypothetical protein